jgi:hypothetical protein
MIMRRLGQLEDAAADGRLALDFKLATSPPVAVAWAAAFCVDALTCLGRLDEAETVAATAAAREPPAGWIHTLTFLQARGALRVAQHRPADALTDLLAAGAGWHALGVDNPAIASWRSAAAAAHAALGRHDEALALAAEQLALARKASGPVTLGIALRAYARAAPAGDDAKGPLSEAVGLLEDKRRTTGRRPSRRGPVQPPDRRAPVRHPGHRGDASPPRLPQARHHLACRPAPGHRRGKSNSLSRRRGWRRPWPRSVRRCAARAGWRSGCVPCSGAPARTGREVAGGARAGLGAARVRTG